MKSRNKINPQTTDDLPAIRMYLGGVTKSDTGVTKSDTSDVRNGTKSDTGVTKSATSYRKEGRTGREEGRTAEPPSRQPLRTVGGLPGTTEPLAEDDGDYVAHSTAQFNVAKMLGNPVIRMTYLSADLPISFCPLNTPKACQAAASQWVYLFVTNRMCEVQSRKSSGFMVPTNMREVRLLGNAIAPLLSDSKWEPRVTEFIQWCAANKPGWVPILMAHYLTDWQEVKSAAGGKR
jgi:hypothetical protein